MAILKLTDQKKLTHEKIIRQPPGIFQKMNRQNKSLAHIDEIVGHVIMKATSDAYPG